MLGSSLDRRRTRVDVSCVRRITRDRRSLWVFCIATLAPCWSGRFIGLPSRAGCCSRLEVNPVTGESYPVSTPQFLGCSSVPAGFELKRLTFHRWQRRVGIENYSDYLGFFLFREHTRGYGHRGHDFVLKMWLDVTRWA